MQCPGCKKQVVKKGLRPSKSYKVKCPFCMNIFHICYKDDAIELLPEVKWDKKITCGHWVIAIFFFIGISWLINLEGAGRPSFGLESILVILASATLSMSILLAWYEHWRSKGWRLYLVCVHVMIMLLGIPGTFLGLAISWHLMRSKGDFFPGFSFGLGMIAFIITCMLGVMVWFSYTSIRYFRNYSAS